MQEKKIYSLNVIAYLISKDISVNWNKDSNNKVYVIVDDDVSDLLEEYKNNADLQKFLHSYKIVRKKIKELNN